MSRREKPSHIPLFVDSYLADTTHLTTEQHGAYLLLLMAAWRNDDCSLPHNEDRLAKFAGVSLARWRKIGPDILEMWTCESGRCRQKRLVREWDYVRGKRQQARDAVASRETKRSIGRCIETTSDDEHLGEGVGEGPIQERSLVRSTTSREAGPFSVIAGGAK